ncbi:hypothetical protein [Paracoccus sp. NSM]|uniref:hypothetical protein n=1 Tax=Paracoccus sp. NSM TaxID=3457784 RepID=UPI004034F74E
MNPVLIFKAIRDLNATIEQANRLAGPDRRYSLAVSNRSFWFMAVAALAQLLAALGLGFPLPIDVTAETAYAVVTVALMLWAGIERVRGKTRAIWNRKQGADALTEALRAAVGDEKGR